MSSRRTWLGLVALFAASALWFAPELGSRAPGPDEIAYFQGFELSMHGASPYGAPRYLYTPAFARFGGFLLSRVGFFATAVALRLVNLGAACLLASGAFAVVPSLRRFWFPLSALTLIAFRPITTALTLGNLSPFAAFTTFAGLALATTLPGVAGVVFALGLVVKPVGLPALLILAAHRSQDGSRRHLVAVGVAAFSFFAALLTVDSHLLPAMLRNGGPLDSNTNLALGRVFAAVKVDLPAGVYASLVLIACVLWVRARGVGPWGLMAIAGLASLLWPPRVWIHSFAFALPAVAFAIGAANEALRGSRNVASMEGRTSVVATSARQRAMLTATWTLLGVTCVELADAIGDLGTAMPSLPWNPAFHAAIPLVAVVLLTRVAARPPGATL